MAKRMVIFIAVIAGTLATAALSDNGSDPVSARKDVMKTYLALIKFLADIANGKTEYEPKAAHDAAHAMLAASKIEIDTLWVPGTAQGEVAESRSKVTIWEDFEKFEDVAEEMENAAVAVDIASQQGLIPLQQAMPALGAACKSCHQAYRGPKN